MRESNMPYYAIIVLLCIVFFAPMLQGMPGQHGDLVSYFSYIKHFYAESIARYNEVPLWNPIVYSGVPFLANSQTNVFYPLTLLFLLGETDCLFSLFIALHFFLAAAFMYGFGKTIKLGSYPALVAAIAYGFTGYMSTQIYAGHLTVISSFAWIPLIFLCFERFRQGRKMVYALLLGLALALQLLGGHAQFTLYSMLLLAVYATAMFLLSGVKAFYNADSLELKKNFRAYFAFAAIALLAAAALSAAQLLPSLELGMVSGRESSMSFEIASSFSMPYHNLITFILPNFFGNPVNHTFWGTIFYDTLESYTGIIVLLLALTALFFARRRYAIALAVVALFSLLFAFGSNFPLFHFFYEWVPGFSLFRVPARTLLLLCFAVAAMAGLGTQALLSRKEHRHFGKFTKLMLAFAAAAVIAAAIAFFFREQVISFGEQLMLQKYAGFPAEKIEYFASQVPAVFNWIARDLLVLCFSLLAFAVVCIVRQQGRLSTEKMRLLKAVIALVLVFDLFFFGWVFFTVHSPQETFASKPYIDFLKQDSSLFRVRDYNMLLEQNIAERHGLQKINGYEFSVIIKEYVELTDLLARDGKGYDIRELTVSNFQIDEVPRPEILDMLNLKYVLSRQPIESERFALVFEDSEALVYENKHVMPRAFAVGKAIAIPGSEERLDFIASPSFNPSEVVVLEKQLEGLDNGAAFREAGIKFYSPNRILVEADFQEAGFLVLSEIYYPGWKAFVEGEEVELLRANHALRAVYLEKGEHEVEFVFSQENYLLGYAVSAAALIVVLAAIALRKRLPKS